MSSGPGSSPPKNRVSVFGPGPNIPDPDPN
mgnify:CR=1 FL=1